MRTSYRFFIPFLRLAGPFWNTEDKRLVRTLSALLLVLTVLQIVISVLITIWSANLFDALDQRSMSRFLTQIGLIALIFLANIAITAGHLKVKRRLQMEWRKWLTDKLIGQWMRDGHHYMVSHIQGEHNNPDGRIAEDIRIATESAIDLLHTLIYCILLLISFTEILWTLSGTIILDLGLFEVPIRGHLVLIAIVYAAGASTLGWWIGRPLTQATDYRQTVEADFRFALVKARENTQAIALIHGDQHEAKRFHSLFAQINKAWTEQTAAWEKIIMFSSGYSVLSAAFPILVSAPRYIMGTISLGALMQSAQSFQHMVSALSWPVDNMGKVAEWRASVDRVLGLSNALKQLEQELLKQDKSHIKLLSNKESVLRFTDLSLLQLDGLSCISHLSEEVHAGERVLIAGNEYSGNKLFKAIAGVWPWGEGSISLPENESLLFLPPSPYLPTDTLRAAVSYPKDPKAFTTEEIVRAMQMASVEDLVKRLDDVADWHRKLALDPQQRLGLVRVLLHKPRWILIQEAFSSLAPKSEEEMFKIIMRQLPQSAILTISKQPGVQDLHQRQFTMC